MMQSALRKKILLVDDRLQSPIVKRVCETLKNHGHIVETAEDLFTADKKLKSQKPDAVILDLKKKGEESFMEFVNVIDYASALKKKPKIALFSDFLGDCTDDIRRKIDNACSGQFPKSREGEKALIQHIDRQPKSKSHPLESALRLVLKKIGFREIDIERASSHIRKRAVTDRTLLDDAVVSFSDELLETAPTILELRGFLKEFVDDKAVVLIQQDNRQLVQTLLPKAIFETNDIGEGDCFRMTTQHAAKYIVSSFRRDIRTNPVLRSENRSFVLDDGEIEDD